MEARLSDDVSALRRTLLTSIYTHRLYHAGVLTFRLIRAKPHLECTLDMGILRSDHDCGSLVQCVDHAAPVHHVLVRQNIFQHHITSQIIIGSVTELLHLGPSHPPATLIDQRTNARGVAGLWMCVLNAPAFFKKEGRPVREPYTLSISLRLPVLPVLHDDCLRIYPMDYQTSSRSARTL